MFSLLKLKFAFIIIFPLVESINLLSVKALAGT